MLRTQSKIFLRSPLRAGLLLLLFGGSFYYYGPALLKFIQGEAYYASTGMLQKQLRNFIYPFLILLFLAFDYFREPRDAHLTERLEAGGGYRRQDLAQAVVMMIVVVLHAALFMGMHLACHLSEGVCTIQVVEYYFRLTGTFYILNGVIAILAGWLFARIFGRIGGYIAVVLYALLVSPLAVSEWESLSWSWDWIDEVVQILLIMPTGTNSFREAFMPAANGTVICRGIFWIGLFGIGLLLFYYRLDKGKRSYWFMILVSAGCTIGAFIYSNLPASYCCEDKFISDTLDTSRYLSVEQKERAADYYFLSYDMDLKMGRQMKAKVTCQPSEQTLERYDMTLYYAYVIDRITDETGRELEYQREENTLTVYAPENGLESICIEYHGGSPKGVIHANWYDMCLPGSFPYYPIPGWKIVYDIVDEHYYVSNFLEEPADFRIKVKAGRTVYSDLECTGDNCFSGESTGPTLLSGFYRETELPGGIRYVYPYLDPCQSPGTTEITKEEKEKFLENLNEFGKPLKLIMVLPGIPQGYHSIYEDTRIISNTFTFEYMNYVYEETGQFDPSKQVVEHTEEDAIDTFRMLYWNMKMYETEYEAIQILYMNSMEEFGYTEDDFEAFIIENLGQEEWDYLKASRTEAE